MTKDMIAKLLKVADQMQYEDDASDFRNSSRASTLREQIKYYEYGQKNVIPPEWVEKLNA